MDTASIQQLTEQAQRYIEKETHPWFRQDVEEALKRKDFEGLADRFYQELTFGTAGMRGVIGGGTNRMNPLTVGMVTRGLARYVCSQQDNPLVVIAYDSRSCSPLFAETAAQVLCAAGVRAQLFRELRPVPMLSFAVRYLKADAGITITASHNPAEYNGYKVYWSDGAQVTPPHDEGIVREVTAVRKAGEDIPLMDSNRAQDQGLFQWVSHEVDEAYYTMVSSLSLKPQLFRDSSPTVVFTPLHGSGSAPVQRVLHDLGAKVILVAEQAEPDGAFPTVKSPNPEDRDAMKLAVEYGLKHGADIVIGTDPDGDRLGIAVPVTEDKDRYQLITGNQIAVLLCDYLFSANSQQGGADRLVTVKSIVTTDLLRVITEHYGGRCVDVLTGFKYIAEVMKSLEGTDEQFLLGAEESFGYLVETEVRDKDAVSAACLAVEMTRYHQTRGVSLLRRLEEIWEEFGYYEERVLSRTLPGQKGQQQIARLMEYFRGEVTDEIAGEAVSSRMDLLRDEAPLPKSDMLIYRLQEGRSFMLRPSGTEPKIKCYLFGTSSIKDLAQARDEVKEVLDRYEKAFDRILDIVRSADE